MQPGTDLYPSRAYHASFRFPQRQLLWIAECVAKWCYKYAIKTKVEVP